MREEAETAPDEKPNRMRAVMIIAISTLAFSGCATLPQSNTISTASGRYSYVASGHGKPAVVLESGLGDGMQSWARLFPKIENITQVFAYDRAGYGKSQGEYVHHDDPAAVMDAIRWVMGKAVGE